MNSDQSLLGDAAGGSADSSFRTLVEALPAMVCRFRPDGTLSFVNEAYCRFFGRTRETLLGANFYDAVGSQDDALFGNCTTLLADSPVMTQEFGVELSGGRACRLRWTFRALFDEGGAVAEYLAMGEDVTARHAEEESRERLVTAQKMDAVARLAGGIAHDFNNILGGIIGYSDVLAMKLPGSPDLMEYAQKILRSAEKASDLVKQLLAFSRKTAIEGEHCDMHQIVSRVITQLEPSSLPQIRIQTDFACQAAVVLGDSELLQSMLYNIAINGIEAMPGGGTLSFATRFAHEGSGGCGVADCPHQAVTITIADTGSGIDGETVRHIFEPFFTTKGRGKGTGLGLSTAWGIARQHKGCINVDSAVGRGTAFTVCLPIEHQQTRQVP